MPNFNYNRNPQPKVHSEQENSGVSINLRLPGRVIGIILGLSVTFTAGISIGSTQNLNQLKNDSQNTVDCSVKNTTIQPAKKRVRDEFLEESPR